GTGQLLRDVPGTFHLRLSAPREWRAQRMARREGWSLDNALARCTQEDHNRDRFTRYFFGAASFQPAQVHATFNTGWVPLEDVVACVVALLKNEAIETAGTGPRVLTLSRELGSGERAVAPALAARLGLTV